MIKDIWNKLFSAPCFFTIQIIICIIGVWYDDVNMFRVCALLILCFCLSKGSRERYVVNPYYLFILTPLSLLIYFNIGSAFLLDLTVNTWLLIIANINALLLGISATSNIKFTERILSPSRARKLYTNLAWIFTIVGILPAYYFRFTGNVLPLSYIIGMLSTAGLLSAFATRKKKLSIIITLIYISPIALGGASKTGVLTLLIAAMIAFEKFYSFKNVDEYKKNRKRLIICCICAIPIMVSAFTFANKDRGSYNADDNISYYSDRVDWNYSASYFMPYMYIVTPWANLQYVTETQDTRSDGYWMMKPIAGIFSNEKPPSGYVPQAYSSFNTFSFIGLHFKDLGYWGSLFLSLFLGFFIKKVYSLYEQSGNPFDATQYVFTAQATLELFFSNHFFGQSYPFMIVVVMYLTKKILKI